MLRFILFTVLCAFSYSHAASLDAEGSDIGAHYQFSRISSQIKITNLGDELVAIRSISPLHQGDQVLFVPKFIAPHSSEIIPILISVANDLGNRWHGFDIQVADLKVSVQKANIHVFGMSLLNETKPVMDFGVVSTFNLPGKQSMKFSSSEIDGVKAIKILETPSVIDAEVDENGVITASISENAPWGLHSTFLKVALNSTVQPEAWIEIRADIHGEVVPSTNPYSIDVIRAGNKNQFLIRLDDQMGKNIKLGKLSLEGIRGKVSEQPCIPAAGKCRIIKLEVDDNQEVGKISGKILVELPSFSRTLPIVVGGIFLKADTQVTSLDERLKKSKEIETQSQQGNFSSNASIGEALKKAVLPRIETPNPEGTGPLLKWEVANEESVYGYLIYRSESEHGTYIRANEAVIEKKTGEHAGTTYKWRDNRAQPGKTYWYYIGLLQGDGEKRQLSGPQKIIAK